MRAKTAFRLLAQEPTELGSVVNPLGQTVTYYEHPTQGGDAPVIAVIDGYRYSTGFYDLADLTHTEHPDYIPCLVGGVIDCYFQLTKIGETYIWKADDITNMVRHDFASKAEAEAFIRGVVYVNDSDLDVSDPIQTADSATTVWHVMTKEI